MLTKIKIKLDIPNDADFNVNKSSLLHGVIMDTITEEYAEKMHSSSLKPYSQNITWDKNGGWIWSISVLTDEAAEQIIAPVSELDEFYIRHNSFTVKIGSKEIITESYDSLFEKNYYDSEPSRYVSFNIVTPASFKENGRYVIMPDAKMIAANLIHRYDAFSDNTEIYDERLMAELSDRLCISGYDMKSTVFCLENVKLPAFRGRLTLKVSGGKNMISLVNMLADFSEFSGLGIKTALGMGAVFHTVRNRKEDANE